MARTGPKPIPPYERVMRHVVNQPDGCWTWPGSVDGGGYGQVQMRDGVAIRWNLKVHRVVYEHEVGPIPDGHDLHHRCEVRRCVNPAHLEPVPHDQHAAHHRSETCRACGANDWYTRRDRGRQCRVCNRRRKRAAAG